MTPTIIYHAPGPPGAFNTKSADFTGGTDYITCGALPAHFDGTNVTSFNYWFKAHNIASSRQIWGNSRTLGHPGYQIQGDNNQVVFVVVGNGAFPAYRSVTLVFPVGARIIPGWNMVTISDRNTQASGISGQINGVKISSITTNQDTFSGSAISAESLAIGARNNGNNEWPEKVDEFSVFNRSVSLAEHIAWYNGGAPTDLSGETGLIHQWRFEDDWTDSVGSLNGTPVGSPAFSTDVPT